MLQKKIITLAAVAGAISFLFSACSAPVPERKKLPGYLNNTALSNNCLYQPKASRMDVLTDLSTFQDAVIFEGRPVSSFVLSLPTSAYDEAIIAMVQEYKPVAIALIANWAGQDGKGVLVDLRGGSGNYDRQEQYAIKKEGLFSIPFTLRWDAGSAARASQYLGLMDNIPGITVQKIK